MQNKANAARLRLLVPINLFTSAAVGLIAHGPAHGQAKTAYVGVSQAVSHDSNIFRAPKGQAESADTYLSTGVLVGADLPISRQRLYANGAARSNRFNELKQLDNVSYGLTAGLDWSTLGRLSGQFVYVTNQNLASYGGENDPRLATRNIETSRQFDTVARVGSTTRLTVEASYQRRELDYSAPEFNFREFNQSAAKLGVLFKSSAALTLGAGVRLTDGKHPLYRLGAGGVYVADRYKRRDVDLTVNWMPTGRSSLAARLSVGRQTNEEATQNDFSGVTGALTWSLQPSGKTQIITTLTRDTGAENRFFGVGNGMSGTSDTSRLSTGLRIAAKYAASAKIQFDASAGYTRRSLSETVSLGVASAGMRYGYDDTIRVGLGAKYAANRDVLFNCNIFSEERKSSSSLSYEYISNSVTCSAQIQIESK